MDDQGMSSSSFCMKHGRGGGGGGYGGGTKCGRWNPTTEQVKVLTELFRSGLRTPSTDQIQKISSQLSFYGKIESKNVFYWFQNHKARERQKRRRVSVSLVDDQQKENHFQHNINNNNNNSSSSSSSSSLRRHFVEKNQVSQAGERVIETLQLFPLHSFNESSDSEKLRFLANDQFNETFSYSFGADMDHPTLDLRLSSFL